MHFNLEYLNCLHNNIIFNIRLTAEMTVMVNLYNQYHPGFGISCVDEYEQTLLAV